MRCGTILAGMAKAGVKTAAVTAKDKLRLMLARGLGDLAKRLRQPEVLGEILAGVVLGPTVLGSLAPGVIASLFPSNGATSVALSGATLATTLNYAPAETDIWTIISGGAVSGEFNGLPNGFPVPLGTFNGVPYKATIIYASNSVSLVNPTPEPAHILLVAGATVGVLRWRRRRQSCWRKKMRRVEAAAT
jgi:hypothetical protein